jgi:CelD/BcsL family acetyltransferase involved in cellulose biosynthesis
VREFMTITEETFASIASCWTEARYNLNWDSIFVLPSWLRVWWQAFGSEAELYLRAVRQGEKIIGIAPLLIRGETAYFIGSADICDYLDFIVAPGMEKDFFSALLDDLGQRGIGQLDLKPVRADSTVLIHLTAAARERQYDVLCREYGASVELALPSTWDDYLATLSTKQRHEVRRKLRRLWESDKVEYYCHELRHGVDDFMDTFLELFAESRGEKASFMTASMESFFRSLAGAMAEIGILRVGVLKLDSRPAAVVMGFDYRGAVYLYNSAYDPDYRHLSVGLLSKVLCIKDSIQQGRKKWDFLGGRESYKYRLGGKEVPLYDCRIRVR